MNFLLMAGLASIAVFFVAWIFRTRNRRRNIWPTQSILEEIRMGKRGKDKFDEERAFLQAANEADIGYTRVIKVTFWIGASLIMLSFL